MNALRRFCGWIAVRMVSRPGLYSLISLLVVGGLAFIYADLEPRYRLADQVPDKQQAVAASGRLDAKLTGANPIDVLIEFPQGRLALRAGDARHHRATCMRSSRSRPASATSGRSRRCGAGSRRRPAQPTSPRCKQYVDILPEHLTRRFISAEQDAVVVSGRIPDIDASQLLPVIEQLDKALDDGARRASGLHDLGHRPLGDRGAQQRRHDRQAQPRADRRDRLRRRLHRPRVPLLRRDAASASCRASSRSCCPARCCGRWARGCSSPASWR